LKSVQRLLQSRVILWGVLALGAHTAWGLYPPLARYLQTVSLLPTFALAAAGNAVVLVLLLFTVFPRLDRSIFRQPVLWIFAVIVVARSVTNLLSALYTLAIYVQMVNLMVPFLVAFFSTTLFRDRLPRFTIPALLLSLFGALLMMSGEIGTAGVRLALTPTDWIGLGLAGISSLFLALYMIVVRRSLNQQLSGDAVFAVQIISLTAVMGLSSVVFREDWGRWLALRPLDWLVFAGFILIALIFANYGQILALKHLPAPVVGGLLPWRLVSALGGSALLLGERLTSFWQFLGAAIILATLSWYLWNQGQGG
jgi:drug/metabolite transporter (DMT)-like permease